MEYVDLEEYTIIIKYIKPAKYAPWMANLATKNIHYYFSSQFLYFSQSSDFSLYQKAKQEYINLNLAV